MSIKPLDLQVNMNSQVNLSQQEAERVASLNSQQRTNDAQSQKDGSLVRESVTEAEQSEDSTDLDNDHTYAEQVTVQEDGRNNQSYNNTDQEVSKSPRKQPEVNEKKDPFAGRPPHSGSIDFLA